MLWFFCENNIAGDGSLHCKKGYRFSRLQPGCHQPNSPWPGIIKLFPSMESMVSDIPVGDGKNDKLFLQCTATQSCLYVLVVKGVEGGFEFFLFVIQMVFFRTRGATWRTWRRGGVTPPSQAPPPGPVPSLPMGPVPSMPKGPVPSLPMGRATPPTWTSLDRLLTRGTAYGS
jgi:hypothetical protein